MLLQHTPLTYSFRGLEQPLKQILRLTSLRVKAAPKILKLLEYSFQDTRMNNWVQPLLHIRPSRRGPRQLRAHTTTRAKTQCQTKFETEKQGQSHPATTQSPAESQIRHFQYRDQTIF